MTHSALFDDLRAAHLELVRAVRQPLPFNEQRLHAVVASHEALQRELASMQSLPQCSSNLAVHLVLAVSRLQMLPGDLDCRMAIRTCEMWLERKGYVLGYMGQERLKLLQVLMDQKDRASISDETIDFLRSCISRNALSKTDGRMLGQTQAQEHLSPVQSFIACALTSVSYSERQVLQLACNEAAEVLSDFGVLSKQPVLYTNPAVSGIHMDDPSYRENDERLIASSDLVVVIADRPSMGLGVVCAMAQRYRCELLVVSDSDRLTPMVAGLNPAPARLPLRQLRSELRRYLSDRIIRIEQDSVRRRAQRLENFRALAAALNALEDLTNEELTRPRHLVINRRRFRELTRDAGLCVGATLDELAEIAALGALVTPALTIRQTRALLAAESSCGWSEDHTERIAQLGRARLGSGLASAAEVEALKFWIDLSAESQDWQQRAM